jgi:NAD(P)-dependent dehydrogenase (short-subunit alcohol dehydrogenase family)
MTLGSDSGRPVAIVTGGTCQAGRDIARGLASWAWPVVIVYLEHQSRVEATVAEIIAAGGITVAVRADLADDLDVQRLFTESIAAFGGVDVVVHTTMENAVPLYQHAARYVHRRGAMLSTCPVERISPQLVSRLREHGITVGQARPESVLDSLGRWRQQIID